MRKTKHNRDWFDGLFYERFIAKHIDKFVGLIGLCIEKNSRVLDVGCGTGRMTLKLAPGCERVTGIDLSPDNIEVAQRSLLESGLKNAEFVCDDVFVRIEEYPDKFDYAVVSYFLHELREERRNSLLEKLVTKAQKIILVDYLVPVPFRLSSAISLAIECSAGRRHFAGYRSFVANGGLKHLVQAHDLAVEKEFTGQKYGWQLMLAHARKPA